MEIEIEEGVPIPAIHEITKGPEIFDALSSLKVGQSLKISQRFDSADHLNRLSGSIHGRAKKLGIKVVTRKIKEGADFVGIRV